MSINKFKVVFFSFVDVLILNVDVIRMIDWSRLVVTHKKGYMK